MRRVLVREGRLGVAARVRVRDVSDDAVLVADGLGTHVQGRRLGNRGGIQAAGFRRHAPFGEDGRHDGEVVLVAHEVRVRAVAGLVQRVQQARVVRAEAEFVDVVGEVEQAVVQVRLHAELHVPVPAGRDVEVTLHLVALETAVDATAVDRRALGQTRGFLKLAPFVLAHVAQDVSDVRVFLLGPLALLVAFVQARVHAALHLAQPEQLARIVPDLEVRVFLR